MNEVKTTEVKQVQVNGTVLHYEEQGMGSPIVFVHGSLSDYRMWEGQMESFAEKHRVIAYSRRYAFPNTISDDSVGYSVMPHADDLAALVRTLETGPVHLVGHSFGAYIALVMAIKHPELVKSLILGEPPVMPLLTNTMEGSSLLYDFEVSTVLPSAWAFESGDELKGVQTFLDAVMGEKNFYDKLPPEVQQQINVNIPELKGSICAKMIFHLYPFITSTDIKKVKAPTLLITGDRSPKLLIAITEELEKYIPSVERVVIPNASHEMEMDNPQAFNEAVLRFVEKHST